MWKYIKQYKYRNLVVTFLLLTINLIGTLFAFIQMRLGNLVFEGDFNTLVKVMIFNLLLMLLRNYLSYREKIMEAKTIAEMNQAFRKDISLNILNKSFEDFDRVDTGEYISCYTNDVKEAENQGFSNFYNCINMIFGLTLGAIALIAIRVELLLLTLAVSAFVLYISNHYSRKVETLSQKVSKALAHYTDASKEQISGIGVLRAFNLLPKFNTEMHEAGERLEEERYQYVKKRGIASSKIMILNVIAVNAINIFTFILCTLRIIAPEVIFGSVNLTNQVGNSFSSLLQLKIQMAGSKPYFKKVQSENESRCEKPPLPTVKDEIAVKKLSFMYGDMPVLTDLDLQFNIGGKYVIVGKSGCGKSTLLKLLLGQLTGYQGKILFDGLEAADYDQESFYKQMAYIEQNVFLFNTTIRRNITLDDSFDDFELEEALRKSALLQDISCFPEGIETVVGENGKNLSGGQKQRIAIARAFIHNRSILLVDEGTSALDRANALMIEDSLLSCKDLTVIIVSHHLIEENMHKYDTVYRLQAHGE